VLPANPGFIEVAVAFCKAHSCGYQDFSPSGQHTCFSYRFFGVQTDSWATVERLLVKKISPRERYRSKRKS
jgi:hypothetical protein